MCFHFYFLIIEDVSPSSSWGKSGKSRAWQTAGGWRQGLLRNQPMPGAGDPANPAVFFRAYFPLVAASVTSRIPLKVGFAATPKPLATTRCLRTRGRSQLEGKQEPH